MCSRPDVLDTLSRPTCDGNTHDGRIERRSAFRVHGKLHVVAFTKWKLPTMPSVYGVKEIICGGCSETEAHGDLGRL